MSEEKIAYCGLYCGTCGVGAGLVSERASKLKEIIEAYKFEDWVPDFFNQADTQMVLDQAIKAMGYSEEDLKALRKETEESKFDYEQFKAGLEWFTKVGCPGCREDGGMPLCPIRMCVRSRKLEGCWKCDVMLECRTLVKYEERAGYPVMETLNEIKKAGAEAYAKKMNKKEAAGFDNVLDRKPFGSGKEDGKKSKKDKDSK